MTSSEGVVVKYLLCFSFKVINNQAKYEALLAGLRLVKELRATNLGVSLTQVIGEYKAWDLTIAKYLHKVWTLTSTLKYFGIFHIPRCENAQVHVLSYLAILADNFLGRTYIEYLKIPSIKKSRKFNRWPMNSVGWTCLSNSW